MNRMTTVEYALGMMKALSVLGVYDGSSVGVVVGDGNGFSLCYSRTM